MQLQPISRIAPFVADVTGAGPLDTSSAEIGLQRLFPLPRLLVRRLEPDDRAALATHLTALPREDRRTRFGGNINDAAIRRHCDDLDLDETVCFAALNASGEVVGAALALTYEAGADRGRSAEIAVSVAPAHRRRGLGSDPRHGSATRSRSMA